MIIVISAKLKTILPKLSSRQNALFLNWSIFNPKEGVPDGVSKLDKTLLKITYPLLRNSLDLLLTIVGEIAFYLPTLLTGRAINEDRKGRVVRKR